MNHLRRHLLCAAPTLGALTLLARHGISAAQAPQTLTPAAMEATAPPLPMVGTSLALPSITMLDGSVFQPSQAVNRVTLIYWWASTCPFCTLQSPEIQKLWLAQQSRGLQMLALSVDKTPGEATTYLQKKGYTFPSAWVNADVHRALPKPKGLPITLVRGRDGKVLQAERGQMFAEDIEQLARWL